MNIVNMKTSKDSKIFEQVAFHRLELAPILTLYGRMVAAGEWRDYGISYLREVAIFSVFKKTGSGFEARPRFEICLGCSRA